MRMDAGRPKHKRTKLGKITKNRTPLTSRHKIRCKRNNSKRWIRTRHPPLHTSLTMMGAITKFPFSTRFFTYFIFERRRRGEPPPTSGPQQKQTPHSSPAALLPASCPPPMSTILRHHPSSCVSSAPLPGDPLGSGSMSPSGGSSHFTRVCHRWEGGRAKIR